MKMAEKREMWWLQLDGLPARLRSVLGTALKIPSRRALWVLVAFSLPLLGLPIALSLAALEHWEPVAGLPAPGPVKHIAASRSAVYAVVERWGIFRSEDGGLNWVPANRLPRGRLGRVEVNILAVSPDVPQLLVAGIEGRSVVGWPAIYKTDDGGRSWVPRRGLGAMEVEALAIAPGGVVYGVSGERLFRSPDGADTWLEVGRRPTASSILAMAVDAALETLYAGTEGDGLWVTADQGSSWSPALPGRSVYVVATAEGGRVYAGTDDGLHYSPDRGTSWRSLPLPAVGGRVVALAVAPRCLFVAFAGERVQYSCDEGATWEALPPLPLDAAPAALALIPHPAGQLYAGSDRGLWRWREGAVADQNRPR